MRRVGRVEEGSSEYETGDTGMNEGIGAGIFIALFIIIALLIDISRSLDIIKRQGGYGKKQ